MSECLTRATRGDNPSLRFLFAFRQVASSRSLANDSLATPPWKVLVTGARWSFWAMAVTLAPVQGFGFVSDGFLGQRNLMANVLSTALLVTGLSLCDLGMRRLRARGA